MKKTSNLQLDQARVSAVPAAQLAKFKHSVTERVVQPMLKRAAAQKDEANKVRARQVR